MKKNKTDRKYRVSLILVVSVCVFCIILLALGVAVGIVSLLLKLGVMIDLEGEVNIYQVVLLLSVTSLIMGIALAALFGRVVMRPINRFINQMNRLASGDFSARLRFGKPLGAIPAFKEMIESFNKTAQELEQTEMLRADFINNFSHEIKTPLASISGFTKLLRKEGISDSTRNEYLEIIEKEALRLSAMATNVLNLTKVENQSILTDREEYNLSEQLRSCILAAEPGWRDKNISWGIDFGEYDVTAAPELMRQVWVNLIDNAVKFSPRDSQVDVDISEDAGSVSVTVTNYGVTIPGKEQERIFSKFYQSDRSHSGEGNGIGLALVKRITELHSGRVTVKSEDGVTAFTVILPKNI